jgi:hypothetical protein
MSAKMALRRFALGAAAGYRGRDAGETFARDLMRYFWPVVVGPTIIEPWRRRIEAKRWRSTRGAPEGRG